MRVHLTVLLAFATWSAVLLDNMSTWLCLTYLSEHVYEVNWLTRSMVKYYGVGLTMTLNSFWGLVFCCWAVEHPRRTRGFIQALLAGLFLVRGVAAFNNFVIWSALN